MDDVIDDVSDYVMYSQSYCSIVRRECAECIAQGHVTGVTPYCAIVTSSSKGSLLDTSKIKTAPIELKIGTGMFSTTPDTMAMSVYVKMTSSRYHAHFTHLLREKSKCSDCAENLHDCSLNIGRRRDGASFSIR